METRIENGNEISEVSKSQISVFCNLNCNGSAHKEISSKVNKNGELLAKILQKIDVIENKGNEPKSTSKTEIYLPSEGIYEVIDNGEDLHITKEQSRSSQSGNNKMHDLLEFKYQPRDIAEYIYWTGDEKSIALAIEEFLEQGLMSRQQAINFLQSIKFNLYLIQSRYEEREKPEFKISEKENDDRKIGHQNEETFMSKEKKNFYDKLSTDPKPFDLMNTKSESFEVVPETKQSGGAMKLDANTKSEAEHYSGQISKNHTELSTMDKSSDDAGATNDDYEKMVEKIKKRLRKTDALQEIIFELAKTMFYESLIKGNAGAQKAMLRFSAFLQKEIQRGQISANLEKKILGILLNALTNSLSQRSATINTSSRKLQID